MLLTNCPVTSDSYYSCVVDSTEHVYESPDEERCCSMCSTLSSNGTSASRIALGDGRYRRMPSSVGSASSMKHRYSTTSDDDSGIALEDYAWVPPGLRPKQVHRYFEGLSDEHVPLVDSIGEQWRTKQLLAQLPPQDSDPSFCEHLSGKESHEMRKFVRQRKRDSCDRGLVRQVPLGHDGSSCQHCSEPIYAGQMAVYAPRAQGQALWHPSCFTCNTCNELLVDLIYFWHEGRTYCGRHHAELVKPRCARCDELIFSPECTDADGRSWHQQHFTCRQCSRVLGGQRYVMRNAQPHCVGCFDALFADRCAACRDVIGIYDIHHSHGALRWHATPECYACYACRASLHTSHSATIYKNMLFCSNTCLHEVRRALADRRRSMARKKRQTRPTQKQSPAVMSTSLVCRNLPSDDDSDYEVLVPPPPNRVQPRTKAPQPCMHRPRSLPDLEEATLASSSESEPEEPCNCGSRKNSNNSYERAVADAVVRRPQRRSHSKSHHANPKDSCSTCSSSDDSDYDDPLRDFYQHHVVATLTRKHAPGSAEKRKSKGQNCIVS